MKLYLTKRNIILSSIVIIMLVIAIIFGFNYYQAQENQKLINNYTTEIQEISNKFNEEEDRVKKLEILNLILNDYEKYENSKDSNDEVKTHYKVAIENIRKNFKLEYDKMIEENTLNDIENITDKDKLNKAKTNLTTLLDTITSEVDVVCTTDEMKEYESKINELNVKYDLRVESINEEENKAKEKEEAKNVSNSNNIVTNDGGNSASSSAGGSTSNNSGSSNAPVNTPTAPTPEVSTPAPAPETPSTPSNRPWNAGYKWYTSANGTTVWINPYTGDYYDENGNYLYNIDDITG